MVNNSKILIAGLILATLILIIPASQVRLDPSGFSFDTADSDGYKDYLAFVESFGTDDYILLAVKNDLNVSDPKFKKRIHKVNKELTAIKSILKVVDLGTLESSDIFKFTGTSQFWDKKLFESLYKVIPGLSRVISKDAKTLAFIVKIDNENLNGFELETQLEKMKQIIVTAFPEYPRCYAAGIPVLRAAFERYNLLNALVFGSLGLLFGTLLAFYIFKTLWAGILVLLTSLGSLIWTLGIMGFFGMPLNLATGLSFGFILVVSTTTVFHIISKYIQLIENDSKDIALIKTFEIVLRPCFMCSLTTAAGFFCLTISPVKMVQQAGIIISIGVILAFLFTLVITSFCLPRFFMSYESIAFKIKKDFLEHIVKNYMIAGFKKPGFSVLTGIMVLIFLLTGIPKIKTIKHLTNPIIKTTQEAQDLKFIEQHISTATSFSIILTSLGNSFDSKKFWYDLYQFEKKIKSINGIQGLESLTPLVFRLALKLSPIGIKPEIIFHQIMSKSLENDMLRSYLDPVSKKLRIIVHIQNQTSDQIEHILKQVKKDAEITFAQENRVTLSGQLILLRSQTTDLVSSQIKTLFLAFFIITLLMMFQLKSFILGLLSLIPNLFPLVTIFGIMGWFKIPLDPLTIFAAVISFGLSVDDSIHYLTQLKREMFISKAKTCIQDSLKAAYDITSRALVSTTAVLFLSSLGLLFSSFSHVFSLGVLIASASIIALIADLIFMPALVLTFMPLNRLLSLKMKNLVVLTNKK
ncbi:MAG: MMPL family transporter [Deltaproteobacteria bacterium]|uniref:efflux RND transporter permease subunit n=1 Tax=Desulfobacula sp. TaxID=2593537 RepID=UPI0019C3E3AB|nr:MMPL family transporter [Candidatus Desulfobacula maris]MBL6994556.1 MMPL family transporter [Desulfobacula sp.]